MAVLDAELSASGISRDAWILSRHETAAELLRTAGFSPVEAHRIATALMGHWAIETGWGAREWRFNVGNIIAANWSGDTQVLPDGIRYRAYASPREGVADALGLARSGRYAEAWRGLAGGGAGLAWYDALMRAGWHPWSQGALDTYASTLRRVAQLVPAPTRPATPVALVVGAAALATALGWLALRTLRSP